MKKKLENFSASLPITNANGCYEICLESIGGLGANLCGKLLGELGAAYLGFNAASFSSYGSEKRGSPVKSYVRWSDANHEILHNSPITHPNLLVLFHQALAKTFPVTAGLTEDSILVVNTDRSPADMREELKLHAGKIGCVNALELALKTKSRVNMVLLGALAKASGFIPLDAVKQVVSDALGKKYPALLKNNLAGVEEGYSKLNLESFPKDTRFPQIPYREAKSKWGYQNAPIGGMNPQYGSTVSNDLSPSREGYIPLFLEDKCIHCGLCDTTCPDMVFQFLPGEYRGKTIMMNRGLDYHHCKGCLRCVKICPTNALVAGKEQEHPEKRWFVRNKDLIAEHLDFEPSGSNPWITSESYLTEKRVDGGLM